MSPEQYRRFRRVVDALIGADKRMSLREWMVRRLVVHHLDAVFGLRQAPRPRYANSAAVRGELALLLSLIAHSEHPGDQETAGRAFTAGQKAAGETGLTLMPVEHLQPAELDAALDAMAMATPLLKSVLLQACAACLLFNGRSQVASRELLRTIAADLDSPIPLVTPNAVAISTP